VIAPDRILRCLTFMEAVWNGDAEAMESLSTSGAGEEPLGALLAQYGDLVLQTLVTAQFGVNDDQADDEREAAVERMRLDPGVQVSVVLAETLKAWAGTDASVPAAAGIARSVLSAILAFSEDATEDSVVPMLAKLREDALRAS
jgi:hypothetical protein